MFIAFYKIIPNLLTLLRLVFLYLGIASYYENSPYFFLGYIFISLLTDFLDGFLARALNATSKIGSILDPACDRIITFVMFYFFYKEGLLSRFYFILLLIRPTAQISAFLIAKFYGFNFYIKPGFPSKLHSLFVFSLIFLLCLSLAFMTKNICKSICWLGFGCIWSLLGNLAF